MCYKLNSSGNNKILYKVKNVIGINLKILILNLIIFVEILTF